MKHTKILQPGERIAEMWRSLNHTKSEGDLLGMTACCLFFRQKLGHVSWKVPGSEKKKFSIQSRLKLGTCHKNMMKVYMGHRCTQTYKKTFRANYYKPGAGRKTPCAANAWSLGDLFDLEKFHCVFTLSPATASNNCTYPQFATIGDRTEELVWLRTCVLILQSWVCFNAINKWARKSVRNLSWSAELFVAFASYSAVDYLFCLAFQFLDWYMFLGLKVFCVAIRDAVFCLVCLFFIPSQKDFWEVIGCAFKPQNGNWESDSGTLTEQFLLILGLAASSCVGVNEVSVARKQSKKSHAHLLLASKALRKKKR